MARKSKAAKSKKDKGLHARVIVLMTDEQQGWLLAQSETTGAPVANIVRRAVDEYRDRLTKRRKASVRPVQPKVIAEQDAPAEGDASEPEDITF